MAHSTRVNDLIAMVIALTSVGCSQPEVGECTDPCGTAIIVTTASFQTVVPLFAGSSNEFAAGDLLFLRLANLGPERRTMDDDGFSPALAESWSFENEKTIVFNLNPNARWHDGQPVVARDVAFTFELYRDTVVNANPPRELDRLSSVSARDDHTVAFAFDRAYLEMLYDATYHLRILPAHLLDTIPRDNLRAHSLIREPIGNGPYRFGRWHADDTPELVANSDFFLGPPGLARLVWQLTPDLNTAVSQLASGDADILEFLGGPATVERARESEAVTIYPWAFPYYFYLAFNFRSPDHPDQPHPIFSDRDVRRAITMAVDRQGVAQAIFGEGGFAPPGPMTPVLSIWNPDIPQLPYDTVQAVRILAGKGWNRRESDGVMVRGTEELSFEIAYTSSSGARGAAAVIMQQQLAQIGINVDVVPVEFNTLNERAISGQFDTNFGSWNNDPSPSGLRQVWGSNASSNHGRYDAEQFTNLADRAAFATDRDEAQQLWSDAIRQIIEDAPAIWVMTADVPAGVSSRFENVEFGAPQWAEYLWKWRVRPGQAIPRDLVANR